MIEIVDAACGPKNSGDLGLYYFVWISLYVLINFVWDCWSPNTPTFHIAHIGQKLFVLYNASTFASGLLLMLSVFSPVVAKVAGDSAAPIVLAGFSAFFVGIAGLSPYKPEVGATGPKGSWPGRR